MLDYITELLDEINRWCEEKRQSVEIVVNDWGMASLVKKSRRNLIPSLGILLNKRRKDPRIPFKKGEQKWFERNSLNAGFYRNFLEENMESNALNGNPAVTNSRFHLEKTACIFRSIRPIHHSIVLLVQYVKLARERTTKAYKKMPGILYGICTFVSGTFAYDRAV